MINVENAHSQFNTFQGLHITSWSCNTELFEYLKRLKADTQGWIKVTYPCGYESHIHFRTTETGKPQFTNARFDRTDCSAIINAMGTEAGMLVLGDKFES